MQAHRRQEGEPDHNVLQQGLHFCRRPGRHRHSAPRCVTAENAHGDFSNRDQDHRQPAHLSDCRQRRQHAENHALVGERVEERS